MTQRFPKVVIVFGVLLVLVLESCDKKSNRYQTWSLKGDHVHPHDADVQNLKKVGKKTTSRYASPACPNGPYIPENTNALPDQIPWRNAAGQIKAQLLQEIFEGGLTENKAVKLALINNPELFAYYENLEIGYANLLEAGLRQNPVFRKSVRFPDRAGLDTNIESETLNSFLDYFLIPFRERAELLELQVIESEVGQRVIDLIKDVKIAWLDVKALELELDQEDQRVELKQLAAELSKLQKKAGNINALTARNREIQYNAAKVKQQNLEADLIMAREKLHRSLGLFGPETCFYLSGDIDWKNIPKLPTLYDLEQAAIKNRPDMEAIRREIVALAQKAKLKEPWTYSNLLVGSSSERDTDGVIVSGPAIELEAPIFNDGQAQRKKYAALIEQAQKMLLAKGIEVCSEVRQFQHSANIYRSQLENLEEHILPDFAKQIIDGQALYNMMTLGVFALFDLKEGETQASIDHIQTLRHYMEMRILLLHALGGSAANPGEPR